MPSIFRYGMWNVVISEPSEEDVHPQVENVHYGRNDVVAVAEKYFDTNLPLLIVREKGAEWHWHVHGTPLPQLKRRDVSK